MTARRQTRTSRSFNLLGVRSRGERGPKMKRSGATRRGIRPVGQLAALPASRRPRGGSITAARHALPDSALPPRAGHEWLKGLYTDAREIILGPAAYPAGHGSPLRSAEVTRSGADGT
ncbi:hypothetical protein MTO96_028278 [Rhipicephalus appendiculatus]